MQTEIDSHETLWDPMNIFDCPSNYKYAVVVLNTPINIAKEILFNLWTNAQFKVTVDGGTDRWMEYLGNMANSVYSGDCTAYAPTIVTGDMDSISPHTQHKLQSVGVKVIKTPDQNSTDYTKALMEISEHCKSQNIKLNGIYVLADTSGRFDHIIANINTLYKSSELLPDTQVFQIASNALTWLLKPGKHRIMIPEALVHAKSWCGLLPFRGPNHSTSTTGLKWNLDNLKMEFGGLISTSNTYDDQCTEVTIKVDDKVVWTMGIEPLLEIHDKS